jgi:hypothetical protein
MLDCDSCHLPFEQLFVSTDKDPMEWAAVASNLGYAAEQSGWDCYRQHTCSSCILKGMYPHQ